MGLRRAKPCQGEWSMGNGDLKTDIELFENKLNLITKKPSNFDHSPLLIHQNTITHSQNHSSDKIEI